MFSRELYKKIEEAIASVNTSDSIKELLIEIKKEIDKAKTTEDYIRIIIKLIELFGVGSNLF